MTSFRAVTFISLLLISESYAATGQEQCANGDVSCVAASDTLSANGLLQLSEEKARITADQSNAVVMQAAGCEDWRGVIMYVGSSVAPTSGIPTWTQRRGSEARGGLRAPQTDADGQCVFCANTYVSVIRKYFVHYVRMTVNGDWLQAGWDNSWAGRNVDCRTSGVNIRWNNKYWLDQLQKIPTPQPTAMPTKPPLTPSPTPSPTPLPTAYPTPLPTPMPTPLPTPFPTLLPTPVPTAQPTSSPTQCATGFIWTDCAVKMLTGGKPNQPGLAFGNPTPDSCFATDQGTQLQGLDQMSWFSMYMMHMFEGQSWGTGPSSVDVTAGTNEFSSCESGFRWTDCGIQALGGAQGSKGLSELGNPAPSSCLEQAQGMKLHSITADEWLSKFVFNLLRKE